MANTVYIAADILTRYDLYRYGCGGVETKDGVVRITMCSPSLKELTAIVPKGASRTQILRAICQTIWEYDPDGDYHNALQANGGRNSESFPAEIESSYRDAKQWFSAKALDMMAAELNGWEKKSAQCGRNASGCVRPHRQSEGGGLEAEANLPPHRRRATVEKGGEIFGGGSGCGGSDAFRAEGIREGLRPFG